MIGLTMRVFRWRRFLPIWLCMSLLLAAPAWVHAQTDLVSPWDNAATAAAGRGGQAGAPAARKSAAAGKSASRQGGSCPVISMPPRDMEAQGYYTDRAHYSVIDKQKKEKAAKDTASFRQAARAVVDQADRYVLRGDRQAALCAEQSLYQLAKSGAMAGEMKGRQANFTQGWLLNAFATAWLKVRDSHDFNHQEVEVINAWLVGMAHAVKDFYTERGSVNNLLYWGGLAVTSVGIAANDRELFDWGVDCYRKGVGIIQADGTLEAEMKRGERALRYHMFALAPLAMIAELASYNGLNLYEINDRALGRLVHVTAAGIKDPSEFTRKSGVTQLKLQQKGLQLNWLRAYLKHYPEKGYEDLLEKNPQTFNLYLGGDYRIR